MITPGLTGSSQRRRRVSAASGAAVTQESQDTQPIQNLFIADSSIADSNEEIDIYQTITTVHADILSEKEQEDKRSSNLIVESELSVDFGTIQSPVSQLIEITLTEESSEDLIFTGCTISMTPSFNFAGGERRSSMFSVNIENGNRITIGINGHIINSPALSWSDGDGSKWPIHNNEVLRINLSAIDKNAVIYTGYITVVKDN